MNWFQPKPAKGRRIGIGFQTKGVSLVEINDAGGVRHLKHCGFYPAEDDTAQGNVLAKLAKELKLKDAPVNIVLDPSMYTLLQVEAPEVEPEELRSALRWRIKDLIDFHIDDAVLDVFDLPESNRTGLTKLMYVVVVRSSLIQRIVDLTENAGFRINAIDIHELSTRNLMASLYGPETVQALLHLGPGFGSIEIIKGDILYLTRRLTLSADDFFAHSGEALEDVMDALVLELQRSLDYYESHYGQGAANGVVVVVPDQYSSSLLAYADSNLLIPASALSLADHFSGIEAIPNDLLAGNLPVIGSALRSL